jgi:hypothetical protein
MAELYASAEMVIRLKRERRAAAEEGMKCVTGAREACWSLRI